MNIWIFYKMIFYKIKKEPHYHGSFQYIIIDDS